MHQALETLHRHLRAILENDIETYRQTTAEDLSLYEWYFFPERIDGLEFHEFVMGEGASQGSRIAQGQRVRYDLLNLRLQDYGETVIASYTLLRTIAGPDGISFERHNESRVLIRRADRWLVVHAHKSPAWPAPYMG